MKKPTFRRRKEKKVVPSRITNETVAEHRERILAGGRRFKYPMQYAKHRLVFNTIIVAVVALVLIVLIGWWQFYIVQNTSSLSYRIARVVPLPVASADGEAVRYSDYLMYYNSSVHYLQQSEQVNLQSEDGKRQVDYVKRKSIDNAVSDAYAVKLARELDISVGDDRVDQVISDARNTANGRISQETYDASALSILGWTPDEYRHATKNKLVRQDVAYAIDETAKKKQAQAGELLHDPNVDLDKLAAQLGGEGDAKVTAGVSGLVPRTNQDGGLSTAAAKLEKGAVSPVVRTTTGDGYYFVKLIEKNDTQVNYAFIRIPLTEFTSRLETLKKDSKIHEYISVPKIDTQKLNQ